jgi:hypothetical protein
MKFVCPITTGCQKIFSLNPQLNWSIFKNLTSASQETLITLLIDSNRFVRNRCWLYYLMHQLSTTVRSAHTVFMCFVFIWEQTATCATYTNNWLVFITDIKRQYSETNVMHFLFSLLRIKILYMFRALLAHPQETLHKRHLVYCVRVTSVGCARIGVEHKSWYSQLT